MSDTSTTTYSPVAKNGKTGLAAASIVLAVLGFLGTLPASLAFLVSGPSATTDAALATRAFMVLGFGAYIFYILPIFVILALIFGIIALKKSNGKARVLGYVGCGIALFSVLLAIIFAIGMGFGR